MPVVNQSGPGSARQSGTAGNDSGRCRRATASSLGVDDFGQSGDVDDLYRVFGIDSDTIIGAAIDLLV